MDIKKLQKDSHEATVQKGFWDPSARPGVMNGLPPSIMEKLALIHAEVSEAVEAYRIAPNLEALAQSLPDPETGKITGFASELADVILRVVDLAEHLHINLEREIEQKMEFNKTRPHKHGKNL